MTTVERSDSGESSTQRMSQDERMQEDDLRYRYKVRILLTHGDKLTRAAMRAAIDLLYAKFLKLGH
jgi:hypothetical protein